VLCELVGILATPFTIGAIETWYTTLEKPFFTPPNWVFAPVWTLLYMLMGISFFHIWTQGWKKEKNRKAGMFFFVQLFLNFTWSFLFFGLRSPLLGLVNITLLWIMILLTMKKFFPLSKSAAFLLLPYLLWVSLAVALNIAIVILN
jgi:benzodiazapine receptor